jgi:metal-dependent amidase/aminoacylase/carboxypeptidase family protein
VMAKIRDGIERISSGIAASLGGKAKADIRVSFPPLVNNAEQAMWLADVAAGVVGEENVNRDGHLVMGSEDFSYMLEKVPGAFILMGNGGGEGGCEVHNPHYDFNDAALPLGATLWARAVETRLAKK